MRIRKLIVQLLLCVATTACCFSQSIPDSTSAKAVKLTQQYIGAVSSKADIMSAGIDKQTAKYLDKLQKQEDHIKHKLSKIDSLAANNIFPDADKKYADL